MNRSLSIICHLFLICVLYTPVWGQTNLEQCVKAGNEKDYTAAYPACQKAAEEGSSFAQGYLATMFNTGSGVEQNYTKAAYWFRKAAEQGDAAAQHELAKMYYNGEGVKQDYAEAAVWFSKAAEQGLAEAQVLLADMYYRGKGVKQDSAEAITWCRKAVEQGDTLAQEYLRMLYDENQKAAETGDSGAQYELAERYLSGEGLEKDRHLAEKWLITSLVNDRTNQRSLDLIEKEFGWHCLLTDEGICSDLINKTSIKHDRNFSWYWTFYFIKVKWGNNKYFNAAIFRKYDVMNCDNRTLGHKTFQPLDQDLYVITKSEVTYKDDKIEFQPLEPGTYNDRLFNYVCGTTGAGKNTDVERETSLGTGWPIQPGYIVTNQHVINGKKRITILSTLGKRSPATVLIEDKINDLAVLQVAHPDKLPPALPIAKAPAKTGSKVFTIGYPHPDVMGAKPKLTDGIVNAVTGYMDDPRILQISVPVQSGNSGGPLLNMNGEVIGIVTAKLSAVKMFNWTGDLPQNVNYAVKASYIKALINSVEEKSMAIKALPAKRGDLESLSTRIQNSVFLVIAE